MRPAGNRLFYLTALSCQSCHFRLYNTSTIQSAYRKSVTISKTTISSETFTFPK